MSDIITIGREPDPAKRLRQKWGSQITQMRELRNLTRAALADRLEVTAAAVGMWERGETAPRWHLQVRLAEVLDVPHGVLFPMEAA